MAMTIQALKAIAKEHQYQGILQISYDDGGCNFFIEPGDVLKEGALVTMGGIEFLKVPGTVKDVKTGMKDIKCTTYRTIEDIRTIVCLHNIKDKTKIDYADQYMYF